jgi:hypothetical protein
MDLIWIYKHIKSHIYLKQIKFQALFHTAYENGKRQIYALEN